MAYLISERSYLIPEADLNEEVRRMNAERFAKWQNSAKTELPMVINSKPPKIEKLEEKVSNHQEILRYITLPMVAGYFSAHQQLIEACRNDPKSKQPELGGQPRPLSLKENMVARLEKPDLWKVYLDTSTATGYSKEDPNRFKIQLVCAELCSLPADFNQTCLPMNYASFSGFELKKDKGIYGRLLTKEEFLEHEWWFAALEKDESLMKDLAGIKYKEIKKAFGIWLLDSVDTDQIRAVCIDYSNNYSSANDSLNSNMRLLRVAHV